MTRSAGAAARSGGRRLTTSLLSCGLLVGPVFVVVFLVEGATRAGYDPVRLPVSLLVLGEGGWIQTANFLLDGILIFGSAVGLQRASNELGAISALGSVLIGIVAIGLTAAGIFATDPGGGYPPGEVPPVVESMHATIHDISSLVVFTVLPVASFVFAFGFARLGQRRWSVLSGAVGVFGAIGFVLLFAGFSGAPGLRDVAGLIQRLTIAIEWGWLSVVAFHTLRWRIGQSRVGSLA